MYVLCCAVVRWEGGDGGGQPEEIPRCIVLWCSRPAVVGRRPLCGVVVAGVGRSVESGSGRRVLRVPP